METKYQEAFLSKYKIEPSTLIEKIATKYFGKIKSIGLTTLISEEVEKEGIEANEEFYKMLIEALAEGGIKLPENQKLQEVNVAFEIPNQQVSIPKSKGDLQDFKDIVSTDDLRPVMMGVYVSKDGYLVGTDAHKLVKFKSNLFYGEEVDKIIDLKKYIGTNGKSIDFIDGKYPNYDAIIPRDNEYKRTSLNTYAFYNFCKSTIYLKKYQTSDIFHLTLLIEGKEYKFNPILFAELLEFALRKGFENFNIEVSESQTRAMLLTFVGGSEGLIMPIYSDSNVPRTIPYEIDEIQRLFRGGKTAKKSASPSPKKPKAIETPKTDAFKKFEGDIEDTTYVSRREIRSIELESGEMLSKNDVIDGFYRLKKKYEVGGVVERYDNPLFNQGMQGELSGFGTSSPMSVFANGGTTDPQKFNQDNLMAEGGKMSIIEQILKKYNVQEDKTDETRDWLKKEWEGKNIDDYVMYSDKYGRGGKTASIGDSGIITDKNSMFVGKMALITGDLGNMYEVRVGERTTIVKKNGINIIADEDSYYAKGGQTSNYEVHLEAVPNRDYDQSYYRANVKVSKLKKSAKSIDEAVSIVKNFIEDNDLGSGNFIPAKLYKNGKQIGFISYNGRVWNNDQSEMSYAKGGEVGKDYVFVGNTMMNGEYKPVYKKDNKYYLKYYNPTKYHFLADEKDIKNYRIGRATDTYAKGGEVSNNFRGIDLFEDYEMQEPKLRKIVQKINDAYDEDEVNTKFLQSRLDEAEKIGYTFEIDMDGSAYGLRPKEVEITELKGFEEGEYFAKGGEVSNKRYKVYVTTTERTAYQGKYFVEASSIERVEQIAIDNYKKEFGTKRGVSVFVDSIKEVPMQDGKERTRKYFVKLRNAKGSERDAFIIDAFDDSTAVDRAFKQFRNKYGRPINAYNDNHEEFLSVVDDVYPIAEIRKNGETTYKRTFAKGGEVEITNSTIDRGGLGNVQDSILAKGGLLKKVESFGKKAMKKAKPVAKKIVRKTKKYGAVALKKAKIGFDALAEKVAKSYEGKKVKPKYQGEYGKTYSKAEAKEVGEKVSAKVYRQQLGKRKITRKLRNKTK